ncbi:MAG: hypothetical protein JSR61_13235 [Proteobacteria bacterium]|nr:hypothetical protein [Pseudomonadota bacterium]
MEKMAAYVARAPNQQRIANLHSFQNVVKTLADCGYGDGAAAAVHATPPQPARANPPPPRYAPEPTEQQKSAQREAVADKASRSVLSQFGDDKAPSKGKANAPARSADNAAPQKHYGSALGCIRLVRQGAGDFQNVLGNGCAYPIIVSFCTMSGRGTGAFNCAKRSYGSDSIAPGGSQAIMGAGVPDVGDPFELLFAACRAPAAPNVSGQVGPHLLFTCR